MLKSNNLVLLRGHLGADPEVRPLPSGGIVADLRVATNDHWRDESGNKKERTDWHRVSCFGKNADFSSQFLKRGDMVCVMGAIRNDVVGEGAERRTYSSVRAHELTSLAKHRNGAEVREPNVASPPRGAPPPVGAMRSRGPASAAPAASAASVDRLPF